MRVVHKKNIVLIVWNDVMNYEPEQEPFLKHINLIHIASVLVVVISLVAFTETTYAQMQVEYPKRFRLSGLIELSYQNYYIETTSHGRSRDRTQHTYRQYYKAGVEGYIYHPRLAVFNASISYNHTIFDPEYADSVTAKDIGYDIYTTFLPYRPVAVDLYARKIDYSFNLTGEPLDTTSNLYGARLRMHKRNWPSIRLEYYHWDYQILRSNKKNIKDTVNEDRYTLDVRGRIAALATRYQVLIDSLSLSRPSLDDDIFSVRISTDTIIRRNINWYNWISYLTSDYYKFFTVSSSLFFPPGKRFNHNYMYEYMKSEYEFRSLPELGLASESTETKTHNFSGSWGYRFSERLTGSLSLRYIQNDEITRKGSNEKNYNWDTEGISASLGYARPISWVKFSTYYRFFLRKDERRGDFYEHIIELNSSTSKFRWGILYAMYTLHYIDETQKYLPRGSEDEFSEGEENEDNFLKRTAQTFTHSFITGVRGRIPGSTMGRAYWNVEAEYFQSDTEGKRPVRLTEDDDDFGSGDSEFREENYELNVRHFSLTGDVSYPFRKGIVGNFRTSYSYGESNSKSRSVYYYEGRLLYPISRRAGIIAWWRQTWTQMEGSSDREEKFFQLEAEYKLGKTFLTLEGRLRKVTDEGERLDRILYLRARRTL
jgi:hypothetical protein